MSDIKLVSITAPSRSKSQGAKRKILLLKPPYFTPWTPPLGIAILKAFMEQHGYSVTCFDYNTDPELWGMHHKYFATIQRLEDVSINDGYSKLWWILNAHLLAYANGADASAIARVLELVIPMYGIRHDDEVIDALIPIVDNYFKRLRKVTEQQINLAEYGVVGTSTYTTSLASSLFLLKGIKENYPGITTVMGGGIFADDLALGSDNLETLIAECSYIDHVVLGEGELFFLKLIEGELAHKRVIAISDLQGTTLNMKDVPTPDFSDLQLENYYHLSIEGARSCPFQCSFCSETIQWGDYRKKPVDQFADQVVELSNRFKIKEFFMGDSLMNPYINPFALELIERKAGVLYDGYLRADKPVTNRKFVKMWADSGLFRVRLGIESAANKVLEVMDKMTTPKVISDVLKTLASAGIRTTTYWIVGFPGETEEDFRETCDFIKEHHRYIYELEAHPYYYYPYGQVGSRLYQCSSLYPEEVTNYTKFRVWEINDANPTREVRYERLRRLAKMCADLGLINIYTMTERYHAEDRWHRLHPLAVEVYESGRIDRKRSELSQVAIDAGTDASIESEDAVICYQATVAKQLNQETLATALVELINYNEILQLTLSDGRYVVDDEALVDPSTLLNVYPLEAMENREEVRARALKETAKTMRPARNSSIRAALIAGAEPSVDVLLLVHRGVADARSVTLLFEDLFRIYEQLANKREISLRPVPASSTAAMRKFADSPTFVPFCGSAKTAVVDIDQSRMARMFSKIMKDDGFHATDVFVHAIMRTLANVEHAEKLSFDLRVDSRIIDEKLQYTPGPFTRTCSLAGLSTVGGHHHSDLLKTRETVRNSFIGGESDFPAAVLLNMEFCGEKPWLGQDQWQPGGFMSSDDPVAAPYELEITPVETGTGLKVYVKYRDNVEALANVVINELAAEIDAIIQSCETHAAARDYWNEEFATSLPRSAFFAGIDIKIERLGDAAFSCELDRVALEKLSSDCRVDLSSIVLAVYSIVLSRLTGSEDMALVTCSSESNQRGFVPLRIKLPWALSFNDFAQELERKLGLAYRHGADVFEIMKGSRPVFDVGYIFKDEAARPDLPESIDNQLKLMLEVTNDQNGMSFHFSHDQSYFTPDTIERLGSSFSSILERVAQNIYMPLADAILESSEKLILESSVNIEEFESSFSF